MKKIFLATFAIIAFVACQKSEIPLYSGPHASNVYVTGYNTYGELYEADSIHYDNYAEEARIRVRISGVSMDKNMTYKLNYSGDISDEIMNSLPKEIVIKAGDVEQDSVITLIKPTTDADKARENVLRVTVTNPEGVVEGQDNEAIYSFE